MTTAAPLALALSLVLTLLLRAAPDARAPRPAVLEADPEDVASVDSILDAVYASISGPAGEPRDWDRFRSLMHPAGARLMATQEHGDGPETLVVMSPEEYVERVGERFEAEGFFERELHRRVERFGHVVHVWSTYAYARSEGAEPLQRGVNSYQLWFDDERWWVVSILWDTERDDQPLGAPFLPGAR